MRAMNVRKSIAGAALLAVASGSGQSAPADSSEAAMAKVQKRVLVQGKPCADPQRPCTLGGEPFKPNELSFEAPVKFAFDRGEDRSTPFFAVILKSAELCAIPEEERLQVQALFPRNKVFLHRFFCEDFGDKVTYTNVDRKRGFIAVHAGEAEASAKALLAQVEAAGGFPGANLRRMQVVVKWQLE